MPNPFELCQFVYLHVFSFNLLSSDVGVGGKEMTFISASGIVPILTLRRIIYHINAKYEISLKLAQYFHRKCHLNFFMYGCHGNQSCHAIFIKTSYM